MAAQTKDELVDELASNLTKDDLVQAVAGKLTKEDLQKAIESHQRRSEKEDAEDDDEDDRSRERGEQRRERRPEPESDTELDWSAELAWSPPPRPTPAPVTYTGAAPFMPGQRVRVDLAGLPMMGVFAGKGTSAAGTIVGVNARARVVRIYLDAVFDGEKEIVLPPERVIPDG